MRNADLEDIGEITHFTSWQHLLKLNDIGSWQLDMQTKDFERYNIDETTGILFYRDDELIMDGPIMPNGIKETLAAGVETTSIVGGCDNAFLVSRVCYPVVTGPLFDTALGTWKFGVQRSAIGINSDIVTGCDAGMEYDIPLIVSDAEGFLVGSSVTWLNPAGVAVSDWNQLTGSGVNQAPVTMPSGPLLLAGVDFSTNTLTIAVPQESPEQLLAPAFAGGRIYQTSGGIVDDPAYIGYDTRTGPADLIAKELVYFNMGQGACSDHFSTRAWPHLVIAPPTAQGLVVTSNARGEYLLTQVQDICLSGGINFRVRQIDDELVFETFTGNDYTQDLNLELSLDAGNLDGYVYTYGPPIANMVWGCGPNTGPDKVMLPSGNTDSIKQYGRWESWISSTTAAAGATAAQINANMVQANNTELATTLINASLMVTIRETDQMRYPRDFDLGDKVRVVVGSRTVDEVITEVSYTYPSTSSAGSQGTALSFALSKTQTALATGQKKNTRLLQQMTMT